MTILGFKGNIIYIITHASYFVLFLLELRNFHAAKVSCTKVVN